MGLLDSIVEQRIAQAITEGAFENLPGAGKPLDLDDDRMVPDGRELPRAGYYFDRIVDKAGR